MLREYQCLWLEGDTSEDSTCQVAEEMPLSIFVNGRHFAAAVVSPQMIEEFVLGHLFSEQVVSGLEDVEALEAETGVVRAIIRNPLKAVFPRRIIVSGCGGGASFLDSSRLPKIASDLRVNREDVLSAMKAISQSEVHKATGGVHSVGLFSREGLVCIVEDIGRHNALDKAIGHGLKRGVDFGQTFAASTGRISSDMALKCSAAGIPLAASRGATTSLAIEIAEKTGLCIAGFVRGERMNVYSHPRRLAHH
jgi:FdhD protein